MNYMFFTLDVSRCNFFRDEKEDYNVPRKLKPTKSCSAKVTRLNRRLLPLGHRWRGDVRVIA